MMGSPEGCPENEIKTIKWQKFCLTGTFSNLHLVPIHYSD